jgi:hypothetical protein
VRTSPVVGTGVDPVTSRFSGRDRPLSEWLANVGKCKKSQIRARNLSAFSELVRRYLLNLHIRWF